jgi:uncharacterized protein
MVRHAMRVKPEEMLFWCRGIIMKTLQEIESVLRSSWAELQERYGVDALYIFGSFVRNEQSEQSDVDLLVEYTRPVSLFDVIDTELYLSDLLGMRVDLVLKRSIRPEIRDSVLKEAVAV